MKPARTTLKKIVLLKRISLAALSLALTLDASAAPPARQFTTTLVARGLHRPTGLVAGADEEIYFSEIPSPGVPNAGNAVKRSNSKTALSPRCTKASRSRRILRSITALTFTDVKSAGVILERDGKGVTTPLLKTCSSPAVSRWIARGCLFHPTPTPGVGGAAGGKKRCPLSTEKTRKCSHAGDPEPTDIASGKAATFIGRAKARA